MPTVLKNLGVRATAEFLDYLDRHIAEYAKSHSRNDYILTAIIEKMIQDNFEIADDIPAAKAPLGVRLDARPDGWKSRLYADRYELTVKPLGSDYIIQHLHEDPVHFPKFKKFWFEDIKGEYTEANVYIHRNLRLEASNGSFLDDWIGSSIWQAVYRWLDNDCDGELCGMCHVHKIYDDMGTCYLCRED